MIKSLERILGQKILSATPVAGGNIADSQKISTSSGNCFVKISREPTTKFREEAKGLRALAETGTFRIPSVQHADEHFLVLEWIESKEPEGNFWRTFGETLARLHKISHDHFGFETNNHIGSTPQTNPLRSHKEISWTEYFIEFRLRPLLSHQSLSVETLLQLDFQKALARIRETLRAVKEPPSLVHGDLWGGNFICDQDNRPVLIDPAPYQGHREVDLAMSELFGGFGQEFYASYDKTFPRLSGYEDRRQVYNLYHLLNHWIIFGAASYRDRAMTALKNL